MTKLHGNANNVQRHGHPKAPAAALPSAVSLHAKEIMAQLIPLRQGYTPEGIAEEAFKLARAFAAQESRDIEKFPAGEQPAESKSE